MREDERNLGPKENMQIFAFNDIMMMILLTAKIFIQINDNIIKLNF